MNLEEKFKQKQGITLIALVVTIIVLLILAGITIAMLTGQNGILNRATEARDVNGTAQTDEQVKLAVAEALSNGLGTITDENLRKALDANVGAGNYELTGNATKGWTIKAGDKTYNIDASGVNSDDSGKDDNKGNGETGKLPSTEVTKPYLPGDDFEKVDGTDIDTGLVIRDKEGNEWVWIEVPQTETVYPTAKLGITEFTDDECNTIYNDLKVYTIHYSSERTSDTMSESAEGIEDFFNKTEYYTLRNNVLRSIYLNGGFWVARYEAGVASPSESSSTDTVKIYSKKSYYPYKKFYGSEVALMQQLSQNINSGSHMSSLMFGVQWDLILKFIETKGALTQNQITNNCYNWGNFVNSSFSIDDTNAHYYLSDEWKDVKNVESETGNGISVGSDSNATISKNEGIGVLLTTGASSRNSVLNIYDLAGNVCEQTLELHTTFSIDDYSSRSLIFRGGQYEWNGINADSYDDGGAYYRGYYNAYSDTGFRPIIY